jgi:hypothetical protein
MKFTVTLDYKVKRDFPKDVKGLKKWIANEILKEAKGMGKADVNVVMPVVEPVKVVGAVTEAKPAGTTTTVVRKKKTTSKKPQPVL